MSIEIGHSAFTAPLAAKSVQMVKTETKKSQTCSAAPAGDVDRIEISAQGRSAKQSVQGYLKYLQEKFDFENGESKTISGVPTTVSISEKFLEKCRTNPEKAKFLEENLTAIPDCVKSAISDCQGRLTNLTYNIDDDGNISVLISGTSGSNDKRAEETSDETGESESGKEVVAFNAGKRARQLAAAKTQEQVQQVMALLAEDLSDCKAGLERGACDEAEVAKVEAMIRQAQNRMVQVAGNDEEEVPGLSALDIASLM